MKYFFVSEANFDDFAVHPRIPHSTSNDEDTEIERICVSQSLSGCIEATDIFRATQRIYVHECEIHEKDIIQPTRNQVNDSYLTGEVWVKIPTKMKLVGTLILTEKINISDQISKWEFKDAKSNMAFTYYGLDYGRL